MPTLQKQSCLLHQHVDVLLWRRQHRLVLHGLLHKLALHVQVLKLPLKLQSGLGWVGNEGWVGWEMRVGWGGK